MDAYHHQRRFAGSGDAPPPPHPSHPNAHWYPAPPPPYPPHPNLPYPPQHHQWGPPPNVQHQRHPPPPPQQQTYAYQPPPPAPGNPWPPHHAAAQPPPPSYPPPPPPPPLPGQAWTNHSWAQNHGYPDHGNEEDWATKAKAWAAAKSVTENRPVQQRAMSTIRTENHHYGHHDQYQHPAGLPTEVTEPLHPPVPQSSNDHVPFPMTGQRRETNHLLDRGLMVSPARNFGSFPSTYELEVSYNYSSARGNGNAMLQYPSSQAQSFPTASSVQDGFTWAPPSMPVAPSVEQPPFGHERQSVDPSDQPLEFNSRKAPDMAVHMNFNSTIPAAPTVASNHDVVATSAHSWMPSGTVGFLPQAPVPRQAAQMDPSVHPAPLFGAVPGSNYVPPTAFGVGNVAEVFPTDPNTPFNVAEKSKKPPVPNWLREELLKKKSTPLSASAQHSANLNSMESNDAEQPLRKPDQSDSRSNDSAKSTEDDEDDEDEIEPARTAAINQEIKRVLTEVLLKVTDDLFYEIATKVLNEDDSSVESNESTGSFGSKEPDLGESKTKTLAIVVLPVKPTNISSSDSKGSTGLSSPKGALLSLANYDSDDDNSDSDNKIPVPNLSSETNVGTANPEEGGKGTLGKRHGNHNENKNSLGNTSSWEDLKSINKKNQRSTNAEHEREHIHDTQNGEFPLDAKTVIQPKGAIHKMGTKADRYEEVDIQSRKASSDHQTEKYNDVESSHRHLEKSSKDNFFKEMKADHTKELEPSTAEKYNNDDKYSIYGNVDKKGSFKEEKGSSRIAKHESDTREPHSRGNSKQDDAKGDRKDTRERNRDTTNRRRGKGTDEKDRSRQMTKSSTSHSSRRSQSRSPRGRSQSRKESSSHVRGSVSSDEPSDSVKKRKLHSCKNSMSPSPPNSRKRRVSRSPHSKHSHRKHSPYSSADRKRWSRSISPVKRR
ncbi:uncharacterized protein LOC133925170 [Phragmites australis]|uniref:uncharacterized protein LOC133925170 n=1 Tax=Phragmites australis TaxID=29695 RepID=UPI002D7656C0|nr:uncharacterized protein LOC133925170 [Phragmites australis]